MLSLDDKEDHEKKSDKEVADGESEDIEEKRRNRPHKSFIVRMKDEPKVKRAKNRFDTYLTKTSIRAINFSENKKRW